MTTTPASPVSAEEVLPCPFCNSTNLNIIKGIHRKPVACNDCLGNSPSLENWNRSATAPSGAKVPGWQPIETAPKNGAGLIARSGYKYDNEAFYCIWDIKEEHFVKPEYDSDRWCDPVHWMPLPAAPVTPDPNPNEEQ